MGMKFNGANTVEVHLRDLLAGAPLVNSARLSADVVIDGEYSDLREQV